MTARPPGGRRVASGRLRVDAARAVDKLRDFQLPDGRLWVLEALRAAVASGAERVEVWGDSDDVWVAWQGPPLDRERLPELFDVLVNPAAGADDRPYRLLATGVNAALGLGPRRVDVFRLPADGGAERLRLTPELLEPDESGVAEGLARLRLDAVAAPPLLATPGNAIHLKRFPISLSVALGLGEAPELTLVRQTADDLRVPVRVGNGELAPGLSHGDLLRVRFDAPGTHRAFLALVDPHLAAGPASLEMAELGVVLASAAATPEGWRDLRGPVPLRAFVDADRLPTNASRSLVRMEEAPIAGLVDRLPIRRLVERLVELLAAGDGGLRLRQAAVALLAAHVGGPDWRERLAKLPETVAEQLAPLLDHPLLRDALGRSRSPRSFDVLRGQDVVHRGAEPLDAKLEPFLGEVLWAPPGDAAGLLLGEAAVADARGRVERAERSLAVHARWEASQRRPAALPRLRRMIARRPILDLAGGSGVLPAPADPPPMTGEVALLDPHAHGQLVVTLLADGRLVEEDRWPSAVPGRAIVDCPALQVSVEGLLRNDPQAVRDGAYEAVRQAVYATLLAAAEQEKGERGPALGRTALLLAAAEASPEAVRRSPLAKLRLFESAHREALSLRQVLGLRLEDGAGGRIRVSRRRFRQARPKDAPRILRLRDGIDRRLLEAFLPEVEVLDYERARDAPEVTDAEALARRFLPAHGAGLAISAPGQRLALLWGDLERRFDLLHWGQPIPEAPRLETRVPARLVVSDLGGVPDAPWSSLALPELPAAADLEKLLAVAFGRALVGETPKGLILGRPHARECRSALPLFWELVRISKGAVLQGGLRRQLSRAPLVRGIADRDPRPLKGFLDQNPVPYVPDRQPGDAELVDEAWHPLLLDPVEAKGWAVLARRAFVDVSDERDRRREDAERRLRLATLRQGPVLDPDELVARRHGRDAVAVDLASESTPGRLVLDRSGASGARLDLLLEGRDLRSRHLWEEGPPVQGVMSLEESYFDEPIAGLTREGVTRVRSLLESGARRLLLRHAELRPEQILGSAPERRLLLWVLRDEGARRSVSHRRKFLTKLSKRPIFPTVQGAFASARDATTAGGVLRLARFEGSWLEPAEGEWRSAYDAPVLRLPEGEDAAAELRALARKLHGVRRTEDVSVRLVRLQEKRRAARGLARVPRVAGAPDPRFRFEITHHPVLQASEVFLLGEAAFVAEGPTKVSLEDEAGAFRVLELDTVPPLHVAATTGLVHRRSTRLSKSAREAYEEAVRSLTAVLLRKVLDEEAPLPDWLTAALRRSALLGGGSFLEAYGQTSLFRTTAGDLLPWSEVTAQWDRFGDVWWVTEADAARRPLDPDRRVLVLDREEGSLLGRLVSAKPAEEELRLDEVARRNLARPPARRVALSTEARAACVATEVLTGETRGEVGLLPPEAAGEAKVFVLRDRHALGVFAPERLFGRADGAPWPLVAVVDRADLVPDRTWSAPREGPALEALRGDIRAAADRLLEGAFPRASDEVYVAPEELPAGLRRQRVVGAFALADLGDLARLRIREPDSAREVDDLRQRTGRKLPRPITGELWVADGRLSPSALDALLDHVDGLLVARLLERSSKRVRRSEAFATAVYRAGLRGVRPLDELVQHLPEDRTLSCFSPRALTLKELSAEWPVPFLRAKPEDAGAAMAQASEEQPLFVADGSLDALVAAELLHGRWVGWRSVQRRREREEAAARRRELREAAEEVEAVLAKRPSPEKAEPPRAAAPPRPNVLDAIDATVARVAPSVTVTTRLMPRRRPLVRFDGRTVALAAKHAAIVALLEAAETEDPRLDDAVALVAARILGLLRQHGSLSAAAEGRAMAALLTE